MTVLGNSFSDYGAHSGAQTGDTSGAETHSEKSWSLERLKRSYTDYLNSKTLEIEEQKDARRYRHGSQWTNQQIKVFNKRHQPVVTYNRIDPKINGVVGLIEKLKQAPKAYPRTPKEDEAAAVATAVVRYVLDQARWKSKAPLCAENAAVDGFGGIELLVEAGDTGDPDIDFEVVENDGFFYDPRSIYLDFSDARYMGQGKWLDLDQAREMFPEHADSLEDAMESATDLSTNSDRENKWFISDGFIKRIRVIDEWYKLNGEWYWCIYTGNMKLGEGKSHFVDEKGKTFCKFIMFSAKVDQDGDRYGFVRQFKSAQDEINQRRSKALHLLNQRRIMTPKGAFDDIEKVRIEAARPDGVIEYNELLGSKPEFDDDARIAEMEGQVKFLQEAKAELDSYGPTLSLIGETGVQLSGRAISLQQQAGVAQLGPFILSNRAWKLRLYRAVWNAVRKYWTSERWLRVTDDESSIQFLGVNQVGLNQFGMPTMVNQIAALDVDIIMDEGADSINVMQDTYDAMVAIVQAGGQVPPDIIIELAPGIDPDTRKRLLDRLRQPDPAQEQAKQLELQGKAAENEKTAAEVAKTKADTLATLMDAGQEEQPEQVSPKDMFQAQQQQDKVSFEREKHDMEREKHRMDMEERGMKLAQASEQRDFEKQKHQLDTSTNEQVNKIGEAVTKAVQSLDVFGQKMEEIVADISAPVTVERGADGRVAAVQKGRRRMAVKRDESGRVTGAS